MAGQPAEHPSERPKSNRFSVSLFASVVLGAANDVLKLVTSLACFIFRFLRRPHHGRRIPVANHVASFLSLATMTCDTKRAGNPALGEVLQVLGITRRRPTQTKDSQPLIPVMKSASPIMCAHGERKRDILNRNFRIFLVSIFTIVAIILVYRMGLRAFELGHGMLIEEDIQSGRITSTQLTQMSQAERDAVLAQQFPRALTYAIASVSGIILLISTISGAALAGFRIVLTSFIRSIMFVLGMSLLTGIAFAASPAVLGKPFYETSGIAVVAAILVAIAASLIFLIAFGLRKLFRSKRPLT